MKNEHKQEGNAANQRIGTQQVEKASDKVHFSIDRYALNQVCHGDSPQYSRDDTAEKDQPIPGCPPLGVFFLAAEFKGDAATDQGDQHQKQRQIEAAEQRGVNMGEGCEHRSAGRNHPDFIAIPYRSDRVDHNPSFQVGFAQKGQQGANSVVESFQKEKADEQNRQQNEPDHVQFHSVASFVAIATFPEFACSGP